VNGLLQIPGSISRQRIRHLLPRLGTNYGFLPGILVVTYLGFGALEPRFLSANNAVNILIQSSYLIIFATAQLFALLTRGYDLSVGTVISMISVASAMIMMNILSHFANEVPLAIAVAVFAGLVIGVVVGAVNGFCVSVLGIDPFIVTLGMQGIAFGFATTLSGGFPIFNLPRGYTAIFASANWLGVPAPIAASALILGVSYFILNRTVFGRSLYIIGANPRAARIAGLPTRVHHALAYVVCSSMVAVGAVLLTARMGSGEPNAGGDLMIKSIAAAVIGGASLRGGEGHVLHCVVGGLFVTVLSVGMNFIRIDGYLQQIILGIVVIAAVYLDQLRRPSRL
jgi:ribose transport system permease protein